MIGFKITALTHIFSCSFIGRAGQERDLKESFVRERELCFMFNWIDQNLQNCVVEIIKVSGNTCLYTQFSEDWFSKGVTCSTFLFSRDVLVGKKKKQIKRSHTWSIPTYPVSADCSLCFMLVLDVLSEFIIFIMPQIVFF